METNELVVKKLSFFQKIRKQIFLISLTKKNVTRYNRLPLELQEDEKVISEVLRLRASMINQVPNGRVLDLIEENPSLINEISRISKIKELVQSKPNIIALISNENTILDIVSDSKGKTDCIKFLPKDIQKKILLESLSNSFQSLNNKMERRINPRDLSIEDFDFDIILQYAETENPPIDRGVFKSNLSQYDLKKLPQKNQIELLMLNPEYARYLSKEAIESYVDSNPLIVGFLPSKKQKEYIKEHPEILKNMPKDVQRANMAHPEDVGTIAEIINPKERFHPEEVKKRLIKGNYVYEYQELHKIIDIINDQYIWEMACFEPKILKMNMYNTYNGLSVSMDMKRNKHLTQLLYEYAKINNPNGKITEYIDRFHREIEPEKNINRTAIKEKSQIDMFDKIGKFLTNSDVMDKVKQEEIFEYIENPSNEKLAEIIRKAYGDKSAQIILDRPQISLKEIPNFYIFSPEIIEEFGIGAVHATLSTPTNIAAEFVEFVRYPSKLEQFREFDSLMGDRFGNTAVELDKKIRAFEFSKDLIRWNESQINEERKEILDLAIRERVGHKEQVVIDFPETLRELDTYRERRNKVYEEALEKTSDPAKIKELISQRFFGMSCYNKTYESFLRENSVQDMCRFYNLANFVNNPKTLETHNFSEEDLDALELLDIFFNLEDTNVLKELASALKEKENIINPLHYRELQEKVPLQYAEELVKSLVKPEELVEKMFNGDTGISVREVDGVKIISLQGTEFYAYVTNPFLNNSDVKKVKESTLYDTWTGLEDGISTWSGNMISHDATASCIQQGGIGLGVSDLDPAQIIGMGYTDINTSHDRRQLETTVSANYNVRYNYPEDHSICKRKSLVGKAEVGDPFHNYDEVAALRKETNLSKIKEKTFGGKTMPSYIFTNGKDTGEKGIDLAKQFGIKYIIEYDGSFYRGRELIKYGEPEVKNKGRNPTGFMRTIKGIVEGDDGR